MLRSAIFRLSHPIKHLRRRKWALITAALLGLLFFEPMTALAQGSPFDTGFNAIQTLFTGTIAKVASLVAIVIGGYGFAHGEPGAKKALAGVAAGTGIAVLAVNVLSWLWDVYLQSQSVVYPVTRHSEKNLTPKRRSEKRSISSSVSSGNRAAASSVKRSPFVAKIAKRNAC